MSYGTIREPTTAPQRGGAAERRTGGVETPGQLRTLPSLPPGDADRAVTGGDFNSAPPGLTAASARGRRETRESDHQISGAPVGFVLELPRPPSVNRYQARLGNKSPAVQKWIKHCDAIVMSMRLRPRPVKGWFKVEIILHDINFGHFDCDNIVKPLLDYLQRIELIENDRWCWDLHVTWGRGMMPDGCIVRARPWGAP